MNKFEDLALAKFKDYELDNTMTSKIIGGAEPTSAGSKVIAHNTKVIDGCCVVHHKVTATWTSDVSHGCSRPTEYTGYKESASSWEVPMA